MSKAQFDEARTRLRRILRRCGWTPHLSRKRSGWYAGAAKRDEQGQWHGQYIAPLWRLNEMESAKIRAILPDIA